MKRFRGGLVFKAHRLVYHATLGLRVIKKREKSRSHRCLAKREQLERFLERHGQNPAMTVLCVPHSLDIGAWAGAMRGLDFSF